MDFETAALLLSWLAIALLGLAMAGLMRQVQWLTAGGRSLQHVGPAVGSYALALPGIDYAAARQTLVVFLADDCPLCRQLAPEATDLAIATADVDVRVVVAGVGFDGPNGVGTTSITDEQMRLWRVSVTPFVVRVGHDARIIDASPVESPASLREMAGRFETPQEVAA